MRVVVYSGFNDRLDLENGKFGRYMLRIIKQKDLVRSRACNTQLERSSPEIDYTCSYQIMLNKR